MKSHTTSWRSRSLLVVVAAGALSVALSACASSPAQVGHGPYAAQIAQAARAATSPFEKQVFADFEQPGFHITRSEYVEAMQRYASCMKSRGVDLDLYNAYGLLDTSVSGTSNIALYEKTQGSCEKGNNALIEPLYGDMLMNPEKIDFSTVVAQCFVREKLIAAPFTGSDLQKMRDAAGAESVNVAPDGSSTAAPSGQASADSDAEKVLDSSKAQACQANPQYDLAGTGN
jgi:hypothetical protein